MPQEPFVFPWKVTVDPNPLGCGDPATITVEGGPGVAPNDIEFTLSANPSSFFVNLPSSGVLLAGQSFVEFNVTRSTIASRGCTLTAEANGVHASVFVQPKPNDQNCEEE